MMILCRAIADIGHGCVIALVAKNSQELSNEQVVNVIDESNVFAAKFQNVPNIKFEQNKQSLTLLRLL
jgi:ABC-2 type transport system permease protein